MQFLLLNLLVTGEWKAIKVTGVHNSMIVITNGSNAIYGLWPPPSLICYILVRYASYMLVN